jgi:hypothetical protein
MVPLARDRTRIDAKEGGHLESQIPSEVFPPFSSNSAVRIVGFQIVGSGKDAVMPSGHGRKADCNVSVESQNGLEQFRQLTGRHSAVWTVPYLDIGRCTKVGIEMVKMLCLLAKLEHRRGLAQIVECGEKGDPIFSLPLGQPK